MKEKYIEYAKKNFEGDALNLVLRNIALFYDDTVIEHHHNYKMGDDVLLNKGTYLHGIPGLIDNFDWIIENGFIGNEFTGYGCGNKIKASIGMWVIKEDMLLKDYITNYSGFTIGYSIGRGPGSKYVYEMIPYHKFDEFTEKINDDEDIWMYWGDGTKEVRFLPSLVANKRQIAFILNMDSEYAQELAKADVWNTNLDKEIVKNFTDYRYYEKFLEERVNRNALTTDRETAIIFGLPSKLIEGVFVGRKLEKDKDSLNYIKSKLPYAYICNLDGKIIA